MQIFARGHSDPAPVPCPLRCRRALADTTRERTGVAGSSRAVTAGPPEPVKAARCAPGRRQRSASASEGPAGARRPTAQPVADQPGAAVMRAVLYVAIFLGSHWLLTWVLAPSRKMGKE